MANYCNEVGATPKQAQHLMARLCVVRDRMSNALNVASQIAQTVDPGPEQPGIQTQAKVANDTLIGALVSIEELSIELAQKGERIARSIGA